MPVADAASSYVYQGVWTNWSKGKHTGLTLTLSPTNTLLVIAVLAIFIQLVGTQLWRILQFVLHQSRATAEPRNGLYHGQQVILRNSSSELGALWSMMRLAIAYRKEKMAKSFRRSAPLMSLTLLHFLFWALAGVFSSQILGAGDQVLSRSPFCGVYNNTYYYSMPRFDAMGGAVTNHRLNEFYANNQDRYQQSQQYVQFCSNGGTACREQQQESIPWDWKVESGCPFESQVCSPDLNRSFSIDTGLISSHRHLGLNAPEKDRMQYRKLTTCTILNDAKYISDWKNIPATNSTPAKRVVDAYYGRSWLADRNSTYSYSDWTSYYSYDQSRNLNPYQINVQFADASDPAGHLSDFIPIRELVRSDADIFLTFLSFSKVYEAPVTDPWFSAQKATGYPTQGNRRAARFNATVYVRERPVTTLACAEQHQLCIDSDNPSMELDSGRCTPLAGSYATAIGVDSLNLTAHQVAVATRVLQAANEASFYNIISYLSQRDTPLLARREIQGLIGVRLPDDQWQKEIMYWNSLGLAYLQRSVIDYATGQFAADTSYINVTQSPQSQWLCENQMIGGTRYQSLNFFAIVLILSIGSVVIIAGYTIEDCVNLRRTKTSIHRSEEGDSRSNARRDMWILNDMLEMLRIGYASYGRSIWSPGTFQIPIAGNGQIMTVRDLPLCLNPQDGHVEMTVVHSESPGSGEERGEEPDETASSAGESTLRKSRDTNAGDTHPPGSMSRATRNVSWDQFCSGYNRSLQRESWLSDDSERLLRPAPLAPVWPPAISYGRRY